MPDTTNTTTMQDTTMPDTTDTTTMQDTTMPDTVKSDNANAIFGVSKKDKAEVTELREEFIGEGATKPYAATEKEFFCAMLHVVKNRRYESRPVLNKEGDNWEFDEDGGIVYETIDHLDLECRRQFSLRPAKAVKKDYNDPAVLRAEMARIQAKLAALGMK